MCLLVLVVLTAACAAVEDTGWGLLIYNRDADGKWRVARDAWGPDHPAK